MQWKVAVNDDSIRLCETHYIIYESIILIDTCDDVEMIFSIHKKNCKNIVRSRELQIHK